MKLLDRNFYISITGFIIAVLFLLMGMYVVWWHQQTGTTPLDRVQTTPV